MLQVFLQAGKIEISDKLYCQIRGGANLVFNKTQHLQMALIGSKLDNV